MSSSAPPYGTEKRRSKFAEQLEQLGWTTENRQRFDGVLILAFERPEGVKDMGEEEMEKLLEGNASWSEHDCDLKILE